MNVFTYGSLMYPQVWSKVVRGDYRSTAACLYGYVRLKIRGELYPAMVADAAAAMVAGRLYKGVDGADIVRLDRFEGDYYQRITAVCEDQSGGSVNAGVYVFKPDYRHLIQNEPWEPRWFERVGLEAFVARYQGFERPHTK